MWAGGRAAGAETVGYVRLRPVAVCEGSGVVDVCVEACAGTWVYAPKVDWLCVGVEGSVACEVGLAIDGGDGDLLLPLTCASLNDLPKSYREASDAPPRKSVSLSACPLPLVSGKGEVGEGERVEGKGRVEG